MAQFVDKIEHISGESNFLPDLLSRKLVASFSGFNSQFSLADIARAQIGDSEICELLRNPSALVLQFVSIDQSSDLKLLCDASQSELRPIVPLCLRATVFHSIHKLSHPSAKVTSKLIRKRYVWPSIDRDVKRMCKLCLACQRCKIGRHVRAPLHPISTKSERFLHLHIDLVGPLVPSNGFKYLLTIRDRFTKLPMAIPLKDIESSTVIHEFCSHWLSMFGLPLTISTDRGSQFVSNLFEEFLELIGCKHVKSSSYNPHAQGLIESWHRRLKASLMCSGRPEDWFYNLPFVMLGLRTAILHDYDVSPIEMTLGSQIRIPGDFFAPTKRSRDTTSSVLKRIKRFLANLQTPQTRLPLNNRAYIPQDLYTAKYVWVRLDHVKPPLTAPYEGPYRVIDRFGKVFKILRNSKEVNVSINRLKPAFISDYPCSDDVADNFHDASILFNDDGNASVDNEVMSPLDESVLADDVRQSDRNATCSQRQVKPPRRFEDFHLY